MLPSSSSSTTTTNGPKRPLISSLDDHHYQVDREGIITNENIEKSPKTTRENGFGGFREKDDEEETFFIGSNEVWVEEEEDNEDETAEDDHPLTSPSDQGNSEMTTTSSSIMTKMPIPRERIQMHSLTQPNENNSHQDYHHHQSEFDEDGNAEDDEDEVEEIVRRMNEKLNTSLNSSNVFSDCMQAMELCKEIIFMPIPSLEEENSATTSENMESSQQQAGALSSHMDEQAPGVASLFNLFSNTSINSGGSVDTSALYMPQPLFDESQEGFRLEDIEAELLRAAEKGHNTSTLYLQKINELTIIRNNMRRVLDTSIKKLRDESSHRNEFFDKSLSIDYSHLAQEGVSRESRNVSLFPDSILQELQLGNVSLNRSQILTFDESIEIVSFIGGVIRMHSGVFPNRFLDNTRSLGTYLVGIIHYYAQSINRTNFEVLLFEPNPEHFEWTKHNVNTFTKHLLKRNIFTTTSAFKSTVENVNFFAWLFDPKNDVRSSVVMLDLTPSCKEFDPSVVLKDLRIETETISRNANEMIEHMLYFGVCCVVLKVPCNYSEKQLSTHNKLWRIYVKIFGKSKYMIIFNYKPTLMTGLSKHGSKSDGNSTRKRQQR
ncbi:hypothetical protein FDP41_006126 [Naegleria fowleri]|uniref:Uncharacterized protein n=1 Tax=Naegleria fowleri TaxID=5763 RepID=A0A6A5BIH6_NAEFO|nr:uncharacterized protein FDP41_006126 [Naegleria fowleri]KAF0974652.1 hypothetical protein FDP41_006126 [Naegleria fowleri]CAG4711320.1 unnamed protein product [Naegleria fowleri]